MKRTELKVYSVKLTKEQAERFVRIGKGNRSAGIVKAGDNYPDVIPRMQADWKKD